MSSNLRTLLAVVVTAALLSFAAWAQQKVVLTGVDSAGIPRTVNVNDAGQLATQGVTTGPTQVVPAPCTLVGGTVSVDTTAGGTYVPPTQTTGRAYVTLCDSKVNTAGLVRCSANGDGGAAVVYASGPGNVLDVGDCVSFAVSSTVTPRCISSAGTVQVEYTECIP